MGGGAVTFVSTMACIGSLYLFLMFSKKPCAIPLIPSIFGRVHKMGGIENEAYFYLEALGVQKICVR